MRLLKYKVNKFRSVKGQIGSKQINGRASLV